MGDQRRAGDLGRIGLQGGGGEPVRLGAGRGRGDRTASALPQPGGQGPGLRAAPGPQQQRLAHLGAPQPLVRHR